MRASRLPDTGENLFQRIKKQTAAAEAAGKKVIKLSIGQPSGPALLPARTAAAEAVRSSSESMHGYQDNGSPGVPDFAKRFVQCHVQCLGGDVSFLPIPGIKPMIPLILFACGAGVSGKRISVVTTTDPGYPTPADWCGYFGEMVWHYAPELTPENGFRFKPDDLRFDGEIGIGDFKADLVMMNYPHNPSGQIATREWLEELCWYCQEHNIRIWNDAAYAGLVYTPEHRALTDVAVHYQDLSWAEAFSASKLGNCTGWRVGAMVGSPDFIADIARIKGNTDSGFAAPLAAGVLHLVENHGKEIRAVSREYDRRLACLIDILEKCGMRLACRPGAGFFSLWNVPKRTFGEEIKDAECFNTLMIERTGIVGVPFHPYILYSVAQAQVQDYAEEIRAAFASAEVSY